MPTLRELAEYHKPTTLDEALKLLRRTRVKTVPLAGGTSLVPQAAHDVQAVIDLSALDLAFIRQDSELQIGATTKLQAIADDEAVGAYADGVLIQAVLDTASRHTREAASIAGSIVAASRNSPLYTVLLALDARLTIRRLRGVKEEEVALSYWTPQPPTLILRVNLPALSADTRASYEKVARTPADQPIVCVAARATLRGGQLSVVRIALGGVDEKPIVITRAGGSIEELAQLATSPIRPRTDYFASAEYRREMCNVLVRRVLSNLMH